MSEPSCRLPDGRAVSIDPGAAGRVACAVVQVAGITVADDPAVAAATAALGADLRTALGDRTPAQIPGLAEARDLYRSFGMDPSRHRPSSEALLRRVLKGNELYRISNIVDTCNLASLQFLLPIGMYDLDLVRGDVTLRVGEPGEEYAGIRKGPVHLAGRLGLFDDEGPFGSPTSDSARTCTRDVTTDVLAVIMATAGYPAARLAEHAGVFGHLCGRFCGGRSVFQAVLGGSA
ncbi:hypothetical protein KDM41_01915 [bacterium]|nr:hypothetical protein [bacterium]